MVLRNVHRLKFMQLNLAMYQYSGSLQLIISEQQAIKFIYCILHRVLDVFTFVTETDGGFTNYTLYFKVCPLKIFTVL